MSELDLLHDLLDRAVARFGPRRPGDVVALNGPSRSLASMFSEPCIGIEWARGDESAYHSVTIPTGSLRERGEVADAAFAAVDYLVAVVRPLRPPPGWRSVRRSPPRWRRMTP